MVGWPGTRQNIVRRRVRFGYFFCSIMQRYGAEFDFDTKEERDKYKMLDKEELDMTCPNLSDVVLKERAPSIKRRQTHRRVNGKQMSTAVSLCFMRSPCEELRATLV